MLISMIRGFVNFLVIIGYFWEERVFLRIGKIGRTKKFGKFNVVWKN